MACSDDLPIRGFIGHLEEGPFLPHRHKVSLWTHLLFTFEYNGDQVSTVPTSSPPLSCLGPGDQCQCQHNGSESSAAG